MPSSFSVWIFPAGPREPSPDGSAHAGGTPLRPPCHYAPLDLKRRCKRVKKASKQMCRNTCLWRSIRLLDSLVSKAEAAFLAVVNVQWSIYFPPPVFLMLNITNDSKNSTEEHYFLSCFQLEYWSQTLKRFVIFDSFAISSHARKKNTCWCIFRGSVSTHFFLQMESRAKDFILFSPFSSF